MTDLAPAALSVEPAQGGDVGSAPVLRPRAPDDRARDLLMELRALDDTIAYLEGIRAHRRSLVRGLLEATGHRSSTTLVRGVGIGLVPREIVVCRCHGIDPAGCPRVGTLTALVLQRRTDGERLRIEYRCFERRPVARYDDDYPT